jgi:hypothetical protein
MTVADDIIYEVRRRAGHTEEELLHLFLVATTPISNGSTQPADGLSPRGKLSERATEAQATHSPIISRLSRGASDMPRGPKSEKRPADAIGNAVMIAKIATGEIDESIPVDDGKDPAAVALGRKGGKARAESMTAKKRSEIAKKAAKSRWQTKP